MHVAPGIAASSAPGQRSPLLDLRLIDGASQNDETALDKLNEHLPPLENFILPGGNRLIATFHLARSVCRRAERDVISLSRDEVVNPEGIRFLNRLSDYLFVGARFTASTLGVQEVLWQKDQQASP